MRKIELHFTSSRNSYFSNFSLSFDSRLIASYIVPTHIFFLNSIKTSFHPLNQFLDSWTTLGIIMQNFEIQTFTQLISISFLLTKRIMLVLQILANA